MQAYKHNLKVAHIFVLLTAFLSMQWSMAHGHATQAHDHKDNQHQNQHDHHDQHDRVDYAALHVDFLQFSEHADVVDISPEFCSSKSTEQHSASFAINSSGAEFRLHRSFGLVLSPDPEALLSNYLARTSNHSRAPPFTS